MCRRRRRGSSEVCACVLRCCCLQRCLIIFKLPDSIAYCLDESAAWASLSGAFWQLDIASCVHRRGPEASQGRACQGQAQEHHHRPENPEAAGGEDRGGVLGPCGGAGKAAAGTFPCGKRTCVCLIRARCLHSSANVCPCSLCLDKCRRRSRQLRRRQQGNSRSSRQRRRGGGK